MKIEPAASLSEEAQQLWREMQAEYSITDGQGLLLLNTLFAAWDQIEEARQILQTEGAILENPSTGHKRAHPATSILKDARLTYLKALQMLNLDVLEPGPVGRPSG